MINFNIFGLFIVLLINKEKKLFVFNNKDKKYPTPRWLSLCNSSNYYTNYKKIS